MKSLVVLNLLLLGLVARAADPAVLYSEASKTIALPVFSSSSVRISDSSTCRAGTCLAARKISMKKLGPLLPNPGLENPNPATPVCLRLGGKPAIYFLPSSDQISVCTFADQSFLVTWDLIRHVAGPEAEAETR